MTAILSWKAVQIGPRYIPKPFLARSKAGAMSKYVIQAGLRQGLILASILYEIFRFDKVKLRVGRF